MLDDSTKCLKSESLYEEFGAVSKEMEKTRPKEDGELAAFLPLEDLLLCICHCPACHFC
jgi:hypothetical protein